MSQQIQIVIALQEAFAKMGWRIEVGVSRSIAEYPQILSGEFVEVDLMELSENLAEALDR